MFYAVRLCGNPNHERYMRPIGFIVEGSDGNEDDEVPLERETEEEIREALKGHGLYEAGWVDVIEIN